MLKRARTLFATLRSDAGIALPAMMWIMLILGALTAGVLVTAQADTPTARRDQDRKLAYGAAEAGIQNYLFRLQHDLDLWTQCDQISGTKFVNPTWNGSGTDSASSAPFPAPRRSTPWSCCPPRATRSAARRTRRSRSCRTG